MLKFIYFSLHLYFLNIIADKDTYNTLKSQINGVRKDTGKGSLKTLQRGAIEDWSKILDVKDYNVTEWQKQSSQPQGKKFYVCIYFEVFFNLSIML